MHKKVSGILMHVTSLPSDYYIGDFGKEAYKFIDFLQNSSQSLWQVLPLNYVSMAKKFSPYAASSAFAGNILLISPDILVEDKIISKEDLNSINTKNNINYANFKLALKIKSEILKIAYKNIFCKKSSTPSNIKTKIKKDFENFCNIHNLLWLDDFSSFIVFKKYFKNKYKLNSWSCWPPEIRDRKESALKILKEKLKNKIKMEKFFQYLFFYQWNKLKKYANWKNIKIIGDVPIYVDFESSDIWAHSEIFKLDLNKKPLFVSGVPPDYFSKTGQLWNNPVYNWDQLKETNFKWWIDRIKFCLNLFDIIRIDHFRGLVSYWEVPYGQKTAINGKWTYAYAEDLLNQLINELSGKLSKTNNRHVITYDDDCCGSNDCVGGSGGGDDVDNDARCGSGYNSNNNNDDSDNDNDNYDNNNNNNNDKNIYKNDYNVKLNIDLSNYIIAEDLGVITQDVVEVIKKFNLPGIRVLQFGFGKDYPKSIHLPVNYQENIVAYTGTHDNNTLRSWFERDAKTFEKKNLISYISLYDSFYASTNASYSASSNASIEDTTNDSFNKNKDFLFSCWPLIKILMNSVANIVIFPLQDILCLGSKARMNHPSTIRSNWKWMLTKKQFEILEKKICPELRKITIQSGRN